MVQSKAVDNRISFFVKIENLCRALRTCSSAEHIQLKLTKKQGMPALSFEIHEASVQVLHEVPIRIVADPREMLHFTEPPIAAEDSEQAIAIIFPSTEFKGLKNVVERMRTVSEWIRLTASRGDPFGRDEGVGGGGEIDGSGAASLELLVEKTELVRIKTTYPQLGVPDIDAGHRDARPRPRPRPSPSPSPSPKPEPGVPDMETAQCSSASQHDDDDDGVHRQHSTEPLRPPRPQAASASVEGKQLLRVLTSLCSADIKIQNAIVCIVPGAMVVLKIYLPDKEQSSFMIYYLPVQADPNDGV